MELAFEGFTTFFEGFAFIGLAFLAGCFFTDFFGVSFFTFFSERGFRKEKGEDFFTVDADEALLTPKNLAKPPTAGLGAAGGECIMFVVGFESGVLVLTDEGTLEAAVGVLPIPYDVEDDLSAPVVLLLPPPEKKGGRAELFAIALCLNTFLDTAKKTDLLNISEEK